MVWELPQQANGAPVSTCSLFQSPGPTAPVCTDAVDETACTVTQGAFVEGVLSRSPGRFAC